ncbi:MAG: ribonuclease H-like domain-containing protein [Opitutaceae bacterium]|jgi:uncharacterized protein YprB with RNaseH-like and TPR domain
MDSNWFRTYEKLLPHAACLDIETCYWNGPIAVIGIYRPRDGPIEVTQLVRGQTLTREALAQALHGIQLIITFNGQTHDLPKIGKEFPGCIGPHVASLDLYEVAKDLNLNAGLKLLEGQFDIERPEWMRRRRHIAVKLWRRFAKHDNRQALAALLEYNAQDAVNLYPLAQVLAKKSKVRARILSAIDAATVM